MYRFVGLLVIFVVQSFVTNSAIAAKLECEVEQRKCWSGWFWDTNGIYERECVFSFDRISFDFAKREVTKEYDSPSLGLGATTVAYSKPVEFATGFIHTTFADTFGFNLASFRWPKGGAGFPKLHLQQMAYDGGPQFAVASCGCTSMSCDLLGDCTERDEWFRFRADECAGLKN
jgi:hypothetical protein